MIQIIHADVIDGLKQLPDQSVQCVVTSPPYWGLRDYGVDGQIGLEKTPDEYISKMVEVFREVKRVLRKDGTLWLNLGSCYASGKPKEHYSDDYSDQGWSDRQSRKPPNGFKQKDLVGIPWLVALALQADGWYLRSDIIWNKPNPMPSSAEDRPTTSHEYIFLLTKSAKYFYDGEAIREPSSESYINDKRPVGVLRQRVNKNSKYPNEGQFKKQDQTGNPTYTGFNERYKNKIAAAGNNIAGHSHKLCNAAGDPICDGITRNRRTVWTITTKARPEAHFATFPDEIPKVCISAGSSEYGCCPSCGAPWKRIVEVTGGTIGESWHPHLNDAVEGQISPSSTTLKTYKREQKGWEPTCKCEGFKPVPCVVLDPFGGSGTTAKVARELKRDAILIELSAEYIKIMRKVLRLNEQLPGVEA